MTPFTKLLRAGHRVRLLHGKVLCRHPLKASSLADARRLDFMPPPNRTVSLITFRNREMMQFSDQPVPKPILI